MNLQPLKYSEKKQQGSALVYILIAIALLVALTASFMKPSNQQQTAQSSFNTVSAVKSQIGFIRSAVQQCVLTYPDGDLGPSPTDLTDGLQDPAYSQFVKPYPILPTSDYYNGPPDIKAANNQVRHIRCPGNPGNSYDHADIFAGSSGKFLPPPADLFGEWEYYSGTDGVFFFNRTDKTDAFLQTALQKMDDEYSECEADVIDASGGEIELTSTAGADDPKCLEDETCFRVWIIIQGSASYLGDTDGEETAAGC